MQTKTEQRGEEYVKHRGIISSITSYVVPSATIISNSSDVQKSHVNLHQTHLSRAAPLPEQRGRESLTARRITRQCSPTSAARTGGSCDCANAAAPSRSAKAPRRTRGTSRPPCLGSQDKTSWRAAAHPARAKSPSGSTRIACAERARRAYCLRRVGAALGVKLAALAWTRVRVKGRGRRT